MRRWVKPRVGGSSLCRAWLVVAVVGALVAAPSAFGATVGFEGDDPETGGYEFIARPGEVNRVTVSASAGPRAGEVSYLFTDSRAALSAKPDCRKVAARSVRCVGSGNWPSFALGDRSDTLSVSGVAADPPKYFVTAGAGNDTVTLGRAASATISGGPGNDGLSGGALADRFDGGPGLDRIFGGGGADTVGFGPVSRPVRVNLRVSGLQGPVGARDLLVGIENVEGGLGADTLIGNAAVNYLSAGRGNDTLDTAGGGADTANCGAGTDRARVDAADRVIGCETVVRAR